MECRFQELREAEVGIITILMTTGMIMTTIMTMTTGTTMGMGTTMGTRRTARSLLP